MTTPAKKPRIYDGGADGSKVPEKDPLQISPLNIQCDNNSSTSSAESIIPEKSTSKIKLSPSFQKIINTSPIVKLKKISNSEQPAPSRRYPQRQRRRPAHMLALDEPSSRTSPKDKHEKKDKKKPLQLEDLYDWSECLIALEHDKKYDFYPKPGPSHINYYENETLPGYYRPKSLDDTMAVDETSETEYDNHIQSLYDATMRQSSGDHTHSSEPLFNISDADDDLASVSPFQISTPLLNSIKANFMSPGSRYLNRHTYIATPVTITPTAGTVLADLINYDLPQVVSKTPFYSNCDDVANSIREVGNRILHIPNVSECEPFESSLIPTGLNAWRRNIYSNIMSMDDKDKLQNESLQEIREFFAVEKRIIIIPCRNPPTVQQAALWLRRKVNLKDDAKETMMDIDSPIGIKREKAKIILENGGADDDECDVSLSCSPLAVLTKSQDSKLINKHLTRVSNKPKIKAKKSLNSTFDELKRSSIVRESPSLFESESPVNDVHDSDEEIPSSQVITIKHVRSQQKNNHLNGHTENASNCMSDSSPLVNSVS